MKKILIVILLTTIFSSIKSQERTFQAPDYEKISLEIQDSSSIYYYPKLMSRLAAYDTTLTIVDYRHLYYGYIFQKEYQPYWKSSEEEKLVKFYRSKKISEKDYDKIIELASHSINEFPFDLRQMNFMGYIYHLKGEEEMSLKVNRRFHGIFGAIMSTGDGKSCETSFHVISVSHEYVFLNFFQFTMTSQALTGDCDYLSFEKDQRNVDGVYFNVKKLMDKNLESFKTK
jgi:hypothetical protein